MTEENKPSGSDPVGDFQRWLMRSSARTLSRELKGQARRPFSGRSPERGDVWEAATAEPLQDEAPECAWCPVCRAARRFRQSGPGLASQVAGAGDALLTVAQDTLAAFEASLSGRPPAADHWSPGHPAQHGHATAAPGGTGWPSEGGAGAAAAAATPAGAGVTAEPGGTAESGEAFRSGETASSGEAAGGQKA